MTYRTFYPGAQGKSQAGRLGNPRIQERDRGRRAGFKGIAGLAALVPGMPQNAVYNPGLGNDESASGSTVC
jgi:hypothetical protein